MGVHEFYQCPKCKSGNITGGRLAYGIDAVYRWVMCSECGYDWIETYELISNRDKITHKEIDKNGEEIK